MLRIDTLIYIILAVIGGMLPDVDAENSKSKRIIFTILAISFSFVCAKLIPQHDISYRVFEFCVAYVLVRYVANYFMSAHSMHRGIFHSIPVMLVWAFCIAKLFKISFHISDVQAWRVSFMVLAGFLSHLILDEICSVNLSNLKIKRSFGTAFKLASDDKVVTVFAYLLVIISFWTMPKFML